MKKYIPTDPQFFDMAALVVWLKTELNVLAQVINANTFLDVDVTTSAPTKPQEGMVRYADGTSWNPGSGRGLYEYRSAAWHKL